LCRDELLQRVDVRGEDGDLSLLLSRDDGEHGVDRVLVAVQLGIGQEPARLRGLVLSDVDDPEPGQYPVPALLGRPAVVRLDQRHR